MIQQYRCTRDTPYQGNCLGATSTRDRQGYYINATSAEDAIAQMKQQFPNEEGFTAELWS